MDMMGQLVSSEHRAQTMAEYLAEVQWAVRPAPLVPGRLPIFGPLPVDEGCIKFGEVIAALKHLKWNKAAGLDNIPPELWKALLHDQDACEWLRTFCDMRWRLQRTPEAWHTARVTAIFKKGNPAACENYRPISLLSIGYKIFAFILLRRLKSVGAENRIWPTQFGFKSRSGTTDALYAV